MKKVIVGILVVILLGVAAVSGYQIYTILSAYHQGESSYEALEDFIVLPEEITTTPSQTEEEKTPEESEAAQDSIQWPQVDFASLAEINSQVVGWIYIPDTQINYPVALGEDNEYYLTHLFAGGTNSSGAIFMDCRNTEAFSDSNNILYGHHMKNGSMFAGLVKYKTQDYYDEHPVAYLMTPNGNYVVELFSGYVASEDMDAWQVYFDTDEEFSAWLEESKGRSAFQSDVTPEVGDRILTLSTCSYEFENARFVVVGVLREAE
jgi:sortase B